ncbi:MAG: ABC transporter permease [Eubacteriales bacterium]|jgi:peptide/nickel transport system permease protein
MNRRVKTIVIVCVSAALLVGIGIAGTWLGEAPADFQAKGLAPSLAHPFGTDWLGRDIFLRTIKGLSVSLFIGLLASCISAVMAVLIGTVAATMPRWVDEAVNWLIDLVMGIPHIVLILLISFAAGKGLKGVLIGVALTHWTSMARLMRSEVLEIRGQHYLKVARNFGRSRIYLMRRHILPHLLPQFVVGLILLFPHAILHESAITFLGFGLSPEQAAIGVMLSESMKYLTSGMWWAAFFPGLSLVLMVMLIDALGENLRALADPYSANQ